jgi:hypothetical protein
LRPPLLSLVFCSLGRGGAPLLQKRIGLGLGFFFWYFFWCFKIAPFCVCWRPVFIGKNVARFSNLVPQLLSFCKFWFFLFFFVFFWKQAISTSTQWGKSMIFKNNALKVECVPMIFENLNSFETMLKILKWCKYIKKVFFWIFNVFLYFWIFLKKYQNMGQKLDSNSRNRLHQHIPLISRLKWYLTLIFMVISWYI